VRGSRNSFSPFGREFVRVTGTLAGSDCAVNGREAAWGRRNRDENGQASGTFSLVLLFHFNGTAGSAGHVNALARANAKERRGDNL